MRPKFNTDHLLSTVRASVPNRELGGQPRGRLSYSFRSFFSSLMFEGFAKIESGTVLLYSINS